MVFLLCLQPFSPTVASPAFLSQLATCPSLLRFQDKSAEVRAGSAAVLAAVAAAGGEGLWAAGAQGAEDFIKLAVSGLEDPGDNVAPAFAEALGLIAAAAQSKKAKVTNQTD